MTKSMLAKMDGPWFERVEAETRNKWPEHLRRRLRGQVFLCWQEVRKDDLPEYIDMLDRQRAVKLKAKAFRDSLSNGDSNLQSYIAEIFGHDGIEQTMAALDAVASLDVRRRRRDRSPPKILIDRFIERVVEIHVEAGGSPQLSATGPLAGLLRLVHEVLPAELQYESCDDFVGHAEYTRDRWKKKIAALRS